MRAPVALPRRAASAGGSAPHRSAFAAAPRALPGRACALPATSRTWPPATATCSHSSASTTPSASPRRITPATAGRPTPRPRPLRPRPGAGRRCSPTELTGVPFSFTGHARDLYRIPARSLAARAARATTLVTCCQANVDLHPRRRCRHGADPGARSSTTASTSTGSRRPSSRDARRRARCSSRSGGWSRRRASTTCSARSPGSTQPFRCRIYGDGPLHDELVRAARRARPRRRVELHGRARQRRDRRGPHRRRRVRPHPHHHRGRRPRRHPQRAGRGDGVRRCRSSRRPRAASPSSSTTTSTGCSAIRRTSTRSPGRSAQ